ncbi:MAG: hypothetical protein C0436_03860 [Alphaproteobacteria bacterium]|nr:hypothetical protein [Alphaproteobacteria bacterium]
MENFNHLSIMPLAVHHNSWYQQNYPHVSDVVAIAFSIAERAHSGIVREKKHGNIPYISHPVMVCRLLEAMGQASDLSVAIALLHDVLEDCEPYRSNHALLRNEIQSMLLARDYNTIDAHNIAAYVHEHCEELCNDRVMEEGKRTFQVMHAHAMSDRSKLIKILDQAASVMDDIFLESSRPRDKIERFAMKALSVVKAASRGGTTEIRAASEIFKEFYLYLRNVHQHVPTEAAQLRAAFQPNAIIRRHVPEQLNPYAGYEEIVHPALGARDNPPQSGVVAVQLSRSKQGKCLVAGFDCLIDRSLNEFSVTNRASWYLTGEIESFGREEHVDVGGATIRGNKLVRHYTIVPPVPFDRFMKASRDAEQQVINAANENNVDTSSIKMPVIDYRLTHVLNEVSRDLGETKLRG